jgi:hypothetical protein
VHVLCFRDAESTGPHPVTEAELRAAFGAWQVVSIVQERIETRFHAGGLPAWLASVMSPM